jgi:hypothetical protein
MNCDFHCATDTLVWLSLSKAHDDSGPKEFAHDEVQRTRQDFLMVHAAVIPTRVLPAPQGSTIMPDRARLSTRQI